MHQIFQPNFDFQKDFFGHLQLMMISFYPNHHLNFLQQLVKCGIYYLLKFYSCLLDFVGNVFSFHI